MLKRCFRFQSYKHVQFAIAHFHQPFSTAGLLLNSGSFEVFIFSVFQNYYNHILGGKLNVSSRSWHGPGHLQLFNITYIVFKSLPFFCYCANCDASSIPFGCSTGSQSIVYYSFQYFIHRFK